ncbi:ATP-binding protein [Ginsengibacter hankyongi]|uniref:ATP-binding protein n=1 Tax=Ginsengibacter hankyongi TaxID=2607284 RepID=A0A5J5IEX9_9BACT|nr:ATP-binding protein [Ginsengibacter hankyongi]KAA9035887.1 ATP-binding protein [Ginsengibacter hankyongi]
MGKKKQHFANGDPQTFSAKGNKKLLKRIATKKNWDQLRIDKSTRLQLSNLYNFKSPVNAAVKVEDLPNNTSSTYKVLFAGPAKGKKLTAKLIGNQNSLDVYRIDLSRLVSKYIGETEKNLEKIFEEAKTNNWILFFDEADALFGKRTNVKDSHDRYASSQISYLLQQVNEYPGLIIFSSKNREASANTIPVKFHTIIHFKKPS